MIQIIKILSPDVGHTSLEKFHQNLSTTFLSYLVDKRDMKQKHYSLGRCNNSVTCQLIQIIFGMKQLRKFGRS